MNKIPVTNRTQQVMYVAGRMIAPGETRHFDAHEVPASLRPKADMPAEEPAPAPDALELLLARPVKEIASELAGMTQEQLLELASREGGREQPRKTLLGAIDEALLEIAIQAEEAAKLPGAGGGEAPKG